MGTWPALYASRGAYVHGGEVNAASSRGLDIPAGGAANEKSAAWIEVLASASLPVTELWIQLQKGAETDDNFDFLMDIASGASGFEVPLIDNLLFSSSGATTAGGGNIYNYHFPLALKAGTRLSAKSQCSASGNRVVRIRTLAVIGSWYAQPESHILTLGAVTADSGGTEITPATTTPPWAELTPSLPRSVSGFQVAFGKLAQSSPAARGFTFALGVGASGSETPIFNGLHLDRIGGLSCTIEPPTTPYVHIPIKAGSRVSARLTADASTTDNVDAVFYGLA